VRDQLWNPKCNGWFDNCLYPIVIGETRELNRWLEIQDPQ